MQQSTDFCDCCEKQVMTTRASTNHILHLILTLVTCGAWVFVWAFVWANSHTTHWKCSQCGSKV